MKLVSLLMTAVIYPVQNFHQLRTKPAVFASAYGRTLLDLLRSIVARPPCYQHTAVRVERFFPLELDEQPQQPLELEAIQVASDS